MDIAIQKSREFFSRVFSTLLGKLALVFFAFLAISTASGLIAHYGIGQFESLGEAIWWSFLHMSDTGYLGDDKGDALRILAVVVTLMGALLVLVFLITILATELTKVVHSLALSFRPVKAKDHLVCIGWNERVPEMLGRLVDSSGRLRARFGARGPRLFAVLGPQRMIDQRDEMLEILRKHCGYMTPRMPFGNALSVADFDLVSTRHARLILVPARSRLEVDPNVADVANIKIGLSLNGILDRGEEEGRTVTIEFHSAQNLIAARSVLPDWYNLIASEQVAARIFAPSLMHPGIGATLYQLFGGGGGGYGLYLVKDKAYIGLRFGDLLYHFEKGVPIGLFSGRAGRSKTRLVVGPDETVGADDEVVLVAQGLSGASEKSSAVVVPAGVNGTLALTAPSARPRRVLTIGWNSRIVELVRELKAQACGALELINLSVKPIEERNALMRPIEQEDLHLHYIEASPTDPEALAKTVAEHEPEAFVVMSSEVVGNPHRADAQALICHLHLARLVGDRSTPILVELFYPEDAKDFSAHPNTDILATDSMLGYFVSQVALRPEVADVYDAFLSINGPQLIVAQMSEKSSGLTFAEAYRILLRRGDALIGYLDRERHPHLVPPDAEVLPDDCELILVRSERHPG